MMTTTDTNNSEVRAEQVAKTKVIYLGVDLHKATVCITRIIDHSTPQPAQQFHWNQFWRFVQSN
jgi:hypothetical protein